MSHKAATLTLVISGSVLVLAPAVYAMVERANVLYARAIAAANDAVIDESAPAMLWGSQIVVMAVGVGMIAMGVRLAFRRPAGS